MQKYRVTVTETETGKTDSIDSDGFILLFLEQGKLRIHGKIELSEITPIVAKLVMEKLAK